MKKGKCKLLDCTVSTTGICLLGKTEACENLTSDEVKDEPKITPDLPIEKELARAKFAARKFHSGMELGTQDAVDLMRSRYVHLIGILGNYDAGKTCFMSSLYLLAACCELMPDYQFAGSLTLQGFEDRVRRLRNWSGGSLPKKLADHTLLSDSRSPSLLHIALQEAKGERKRIELLLTDLPGEWTKSLIESEKTVNNFDFLHRSDGIIVVIDGPSLVEKGHVEFFRTKKLLERLSQDVKINKAIPIVILLSKYDRLKNKIPAELSKIVNYATELGFAAKVVLAAAFSEDPKKTSNGTGILKAIETIIRSESVVPSCESFISRQGHRNFHRFRIKSGECII